MVKKITFFVLALFASVFTLHAQTETPPAVGDESIGNPYEITTLDNLYWLSQTSSEWDKYYIQTDDIDAATTNTWDAGAGFEPIGNSVINFTGSYNGLSHTITGLFMNRPVIEDNIGLFGFINTTDTIQNLGLIGVNITGGNFVGSFVGCCINGKINNCYSTGAVNGQGYEGGFVGTNSGTITNCYNTASVICAVSNAGGFAGENYAAISNCYSTGAVDGSSTLGGFASANYSTINNCFWNTQTSGQATSDGGIGKTTAEMQTMCTYIDGTEASWDFVIETANGTTDFWGMNTSENGGYPFLSWQSYTHTESCCGLIDLIAPVADFATLADVTAECEVTSLTNPTATDNCSVLVTATNDATLPITTQGTTLVTWTYDDGNGNTSIQTQNVVIDDVTPPVAIGQNYTAYLNASGSILITGADIDGGSTDNCGILNVFAQPSSYFCSDIGDNNSLLYVFDSTGAFSTAPVIVTIIDTICPTPDVAILTDLTDDCSVNPIPPTATDNCPGSITGTTSTTFPITTQGTTLVTWTYDDGNGNTSTQTQNVVISDVTAPIADNPPVLGNITITIIAQTANQDEISWTLYDASNNPIASGGNYPTTTPGSIDEVVVTQSGNGPYRFFGEASGFFNDNEFNFVVECEGTIIESGFIDNGLTVFWNNIPACIISTGLDEILSECSVTPTPPTATDNCVGTIMGTSTTSFPITAQGTTLVTWTYDDGNGNTTTQTQNVILLDETDPTIVCQNDTIVCDAIVNYLAPVGLDNCTLQSTLLTLGLGSGSTFPVGVTTEEYTVSDIAGNTATCSFTVTVNPLPIVDLGADSTICPWETIILDAGVFNTYLWSDGSTTQTISIDSSGLGIGTHLFFVEVNDSNGCINVDSVSITIDICSRISDNIVESLIQVFPNPSTGMFTIIADRNYSFVISDITGKQISTGKLKNTESLIDISEQAQGIYLIKFVNDEVSKTIKLIKKLDLN